jgi:multisubunit Na+/H+ antiporter MnhB subunit
MSEGFAGFLCGAIIFGLFGLAFGKEWGFIEGREWQKKWGNKI